MAVTQTILRRNKNQLVIKAESDSDASSNGLATEIISTTGAKRIIVVCNGATKMYMPSISDNVDGVVGTGASSVPAGNVDYAEITGDGTTGDTYPVAGSTGQPLMVTGDFIPSECYFLLEANKIAWIYIEF